MNTSIVRITVLGQTNGNLKSAGIKLKPLHEVRLSGEGKELFDGLLKKANACLRTGDFENLEKLGMPGLFYKEAIANVAQRYQKNTCHDYHIAELARLGGFTGYETAMVILEAATKLAQGENVGAMIHNSAIIAQKLADGIENPEERNTIIAKKNGLRSTKPHQHNYPETHIVRDGIRLPKTKD